MEGSLFGILGRSGFENRIVDERGSLACWSTIAVDDAVRQVRRARVGKWGGLFFMDLEGSMLLLALNLASRSLHSVTTL